MPSVNGKSNNAAGRPKGSVNPLIANLRDEIREGVKTNKIVRNMFERLELIEDPYKYVQTAMNILDMILPRLAAEVSSQELDNKKDIAAVMEMVFHNINEKKAS